MRVQIKLIPLGDKVKWMLQGQVVCQSIGTLRKSMTLTRNDGVLLKIFGSQRKIDAFLKKNRVINKVVELSDMGYDSCDTLV